MTKDKNTTMTAFNAMMQQLEITPAIPGTMPRFPETGDGLADILAPLLHDLPEAEPPADLFADIEAELDAAPTASTQVQRADEGIWVQRNERVWKKLLAQDAVTGRSMYLLRCLPGARIKPHVHERSEHLFIIEGELWMDGKLYSAGDAHASMPGTEHHEITMPAGCLVLVSA